MKKILIVIGIIFAIAVLAIVVLIVLPRIFGGGDRSSIEKITIGLPFDKNDPPGQYIPMGETLEHPKPDNPKGHPGIDLLWHDETGQVLGTLVAIADGEITSIYKWEEGIDAGEWDISIRHGDWMSTIGHFKEYDQSLSEGSTVTKGQYLGKGSNAHFEFGYWRHDPRHPDRVCPLTYFDEESRKIFEAIPMMDKYIEAGYTEFCDGDYKGLHE